MKIGQWVDRLADRVPLSRSGYGIAALCLLCSALFTGGAQARDLTLDWDNNVVDWIPGNTDQPAKVTDDMDMIVVGGDIGVTVTGNVGGLDRMTPALDATNTGGLVPPEFSLAIATDYTDNTANEVSVKLDFSAYPGGVSDVSFQIFDVDMSNSFTDEVSVEALTVGSTTVFPAAVGSSGNMVTPDPMGNTVVGTDPVPQNSPDGNATFTFTQTGIAEVTIIYRNTTAVTTPGFQWIHIHDISFTAVQADISVVKNVDNATPSVGSNVVYTITVTNDGPDTGTGLELTDQLPAGLTYVSDTGAGAYDNATGVWTIGSLTSGDSTVLQITALVNPTGPYDNVAELTAATSDDPDSTPGNGDPTEDDQDNALITPMAFADLMLSKTVDTAEPVVGSNVTFTLTLTNDGPVDATGVSVSDMLPSGLAFVSATPSAGAYDNITGIWTVGALAATASETLAIVAQALVTGDYTNTAQVATSDQPDPDSTPGNNVPAEDDQDQAAVTPLLLGVAKSVSTGPVSDGAGNFSFDYSVLVRNYGAAAISNLQVSDDLAATFAAATGFSVTGTTSADFTVNAAYDGTADTDLLSGTDTLAVGQSGVIVISVTLTPGGFLGPYLNTAIANGNGPAGTPVTDTSQSGIDPDPDGDGDPTNNNDPTPITVDEAPLMGLAKRVSAAPVANGDGSATLTYTLFVENLGNVVLNNLQIVDSLATTFTGADSYTVDTTSSADFTVNAAYDGSTDTSLLAGTDVLAIGASGALTVTVTVRPGANLGPYNNTATATGTSPANTPVSDISTDGVNTDPDGDGDPGNNSVPTPVGFVENPLIGTIKRVVTGPVNNGDGTYTVEYELGIENFGDVALANVQITDSFATTFAAAGGYVIDAIVSADFAANPAFDGAADINLLAGTDTLDTGATGTISITVTIDPGGNFGLYENSATGSGTSPTGTLVEDVSNDGVDPDTNNNNDPTDDNVPTPVTLAESPGVGIAKVVSTPPVSNNNGTFTFSYTMTVENFGDVALSDLQVSDDLATTFAASDGFLINTVQSADFAVNIAFDGAADPNLLTGTDTLGVGTSGTVTVTLTVTPGGFGGPYLNTAVVSGNSPGGTPVRDDSTDGVDPDPDNDDNPGNNTVPTPVNFLLPEIVVTKRADPTQTVVGGLVRYTVTVENTGGSALNDLTLRDVIPAGFNFADGSARLVGNGTLVVTGERPVNFDGIDLGPGEVATLTYILRVGAGVVQGNYPNVVTPLSQGQPVGDPATATVQVVADPDIDETTIIGKVFTDHNENGYQDEGEHGIAGVRLATVEGLRIETDSNGRYHIAGVDGGFAERGRNYIVKVDPVTLPPGSVFTTENPRVQRITGGLMNRFDFGVKVPAFETQRSRRIKVKLAEVFFLSGTDQVHPDFMPTIGELAKLLREHGGGILYIDGNADPCAAPPAAKVYTDTETLSYTFTPHFGVRKAVLTDDDRAELDRALAPWRDAVDVSILSIGHTSSVRIAPENRHEFADNYVLGEARAGAVANYVRSSLGIDTANVQAIGRGPDQPVADNATFEGRAKNRRVELILSGKRVVQQQVSAPASACDTDLGERRARRVFEALKPMIGDDLINDVQVLPGPPPASAEGY